MAQDRLTDKQERFAVEFVKNGGHQTKAYIEAYKPKESAKMNTIYRNAFDVRVNAKVSARIRELQLASYAGDILSIKERKVILSSLAVNGNIKAMDQLNRMDGIYTDKQDEKPQTINVSYKVVGK